MQPQSLTGLAVNDPVCVRQNYHTSSEGYVSKSTGDMVAALFIDNDSSEDGWLYVRALSPAARKGGLGAAQLRGMFVDGVCRASRGFNGRRVHTGLARGGSPSALQWISGDKGRILEVRLQTLRQRLAQTRPRADATS